MAARLTQPAGDVRLLLPTALGLGAAAVRLSALVAEEARLTGWRLARPSTPLSNIVAKGLEPLWTEEQGVEQAVTALTGPMQRQLDLPRAGG